MCDKARLRALMHFSCRTPRWLPVRRMHAANTRQQREKGSDTARDLKSSLSSKLHAHAPSAFSSDGAPAGHQPALALWGDWLRADLESACLKSGKGRAIMVYNGCGGMVIMATTFFPCRHVRWPTGRLARACDRCQHLPASGFGGNGFCNRSPRVQMPCGSLSAQQPRTRVHMLSSAATFSLNHAPFSRHHPDFRAVFVVDIAVMNPVGV